MVLSFIVMWPSPALHVAERNLWFFRFSWLPNLVLLSYALLIVSSYIVQWYYKSFVYCVLTDVKLISVVSVHQLDYGTCIDSRSHCMSIASGVALSLLGGLVSPYSCVHGQPFPLYAVHYWRDSISAHHNWQCSATRIARSRNRIITGIDGLFLSMVTDIHPSSVK